VDPVPDALLLRKPGSAGNGTRDLWICSQKLWPLDHRGGQVTDTRDNINCVTKICTLCMQWVGPYRVDAVGWYVSREKRSGCSGLVRIEGEALWMQWVGTYRERSALDAVGW
jgi:hypothetical protein